MTQAAQARVRKMHADDPLAAALGIELVAITEGSLQVALTVKPSHAGFHGNCHGATLFALADVAMSYIGNQLPGSAFATKATIDFIDAVAVGDRVVATATETHTRGRASVYDILLTVGDRTVGLFRGNTLRVGTTD